jgi:hypothetical protein
LKNEVGHRKEVEEVNQKIGARGTSQLPAAKW